MTEHLFIYGTLLPGLSPDGLSGLLSRLRFIGTGAVRGWLYDLVDYPGAVLDSSASMEIQGRVYELPNDQEFLAELDAYEGYKADDPCGSLFIRDRVTVTLNDGRKIPCWIYVYNRDPGEAPLVPDGDYAKYQAA